jgi:hypothetical protein
MILCKLEESWGKTMLGEEKEIGKARAGGQVVSSLIECFYILARI